MATPTRKAGWFLMSVGLRCLLQRWANLLVERSVAGKMRASTNVSCSVRSGHLTCSVSFVASTG